MATDLNQTRKELSELLTDYSKDKVDSKSEEEVLQEEAQYAATGLKSGVIGDRIKAVEFLEILGDNPYAQDYLLLALHDKEGSVVQKSVHALGRIADKRALPKLQAFIGEQKSKHITTEITRIISRIDRTE
ncbi:MAG: hypothetical protein HQL32_16480 [Planctomycetes bacterium]|nr:hypothetical protein [Planctomycetota bacterium]